MAQRDPGRRFELLGDAADTNAALIKDHPRNLTVLRRGRLDAALYDPTSTRRQGQLGRLESGASAAVLPPGGSQGACGGMKLDVPVYGRTTSS